MRFTRIPFIFATAAISLAVVTAYAQDSPPLGDVARQQRQKQQSKPDQTKNAKPSKVITNEEIPEHSGPTAASTAGGEDVSASASPNNGEKSPVEAVKFSAEHWKSQIQAQKNQLAYLQRQADALNESIHFAPGNCVENCVQWNERQKEKQQQVERMRAQLDEQKKQLEDMQESARKQGYGSSVYDP